MDKYGTDMVHIVDYEIHILLTNKLYATLIGLTPLQDLHLQSHVAVLYWVWNRSLLMLAICRSRKAAHRNKATVCGISLIQTNTTQ